MWLRWFVVLERVIDIIRSPVLHCLSRRWSGNIRDIGRICVQYVYNIVIYSTVLLYSYIQYGMHFLSLLYVCIILIQHLHIKIVFITDFSYYDRYSISIY